MPFFKATHIPYHAGAARAQNMTPQTMKPTSMPSVNPSSRKFHPSEPKSSAHIGSRSAGAPIAEPTPDPTNIATSMAGIAIEISHAPSEPAPSTARIDRNAHARPMPITRTEA